MKEDTLLSNKNKKIIGTLKVINIVICALIALGALITPISIGSKITNDQKALSSLSDTSDEEEDSYGLSTSTSEKPSDKMDGGIVALLIFMCVGGLATAAINYFIFSALIQHYTNVAEMNFIQKMQASNLIEQLNVQKDDVVTEG